MADTIDQEGWGLPYTEDHSNTFHWFRRGQSLCLRHFLFSGDLDNSHTNGPLDCRACARALLA